MIFFWEILRLSGLMLQISLRRLICIIKLFPKRKLPLKQKKSKRGLFLSRVTLTLVLSLLFLSIFWHNSKESFNALPPISFLWNSHPWISIYHHRILSQSIFLLQCVKVHNPALRCRRQLRPQPGKPHLTNQNACLLQSSQHGRTALPASNRGMHISRAENSTWRKRLLRLTWPVMKLKIQFREFKWSERTIFFWHFQYSFVLDAKKKKKDEFWGFLYLFKRSTS